jgi:hypothetical protein
MDESELHIVYANVDTASWPPIRAVFNWGGACKYVMLVTILDPLESQTHGVRSSYDAAGLIPWHL